MNDWANIIELICDKLGIVVDSASELLPEIVRCKTAEWAFTVGASFFVLALGLYLIHWGWNWAKKQAKTQHNDDDWGYFCDFPEFFVPVTVGAIAVGLGGIFFFIFAPELIGWIAAPNIKAIEWVVSLVSWEA